MVGESGLAHEAARRIPAIHPDVAILDARLRDGSGVDACREIRTRNPEIRAPILTSSDEDEAIFAAIWPAGHTLKHCVATTSSRPYAGSPPGQSTLPVGHRRRPRAGPSRSSRR